MFDILLETTGRKMEILRIFSLKQAKKSVQFENFTDVYGNGHIFPVSIEIYVGFCETSCTKLRKTIHILWQEHLDLGVVRIWPLLAIIKIYSNYG